MSQLLISLLLCLCFLSQKVEAAFPEPPLDTPIIQLTPKQMNRLMQNPSVRVKQVLLTQTEAQNPQETARQKAAEEDEEEEEYKKRDAHYGSGFNSWVNLSGPDGLIVAFAIVGVVMVIAWVAAFPFTVYKALANKEDYQNLQLLNLNHSRFNLSRGKEARLYGLRYSLYLADPQEGLMNASYGFSAELGSYDYDSSGQYWMIGPSFIYGFKTGKRYAFTKLDLMAGSTFNSRYGLFSKMEGSLNFEVSKKLSLGVGLGAVYLDRNSDRETFSWGHEWGFLYGVNASYLF